MSLLIHFILRYVIRYQMSLLLDMRWCISSSLVVRIMSQRAFVDESLTSQVYCMSLAVSPQTITSTLLLHNTANPRIRATHAISTTSIHIQI